MRRKLVKEMRCTKKSALYWKSDFFCQFRFFTKMIISMKSGIKAFRRNPSENFHTDCLSGS